MQDLNAFVKNDTCHVENFSMDQLAWVEQSSATLSLSPFLPAEASLLGAQRAKTDVSMLGNKTQTS